MNAITPRRMAPLVFPPSPTVGDTFDAPNGVTYTWDGVVWIASGGGGGGSGDYVLKAGDTMTGALIINSTLAVRDNASFGGPDLLIFQNADDAVFQWSADFNDSLEKASGIRFWVGPLGPLMSLDPTGNLGVRGPLEVGGPVTLEAGDPTDVLHATTKAYVDERALPAGGAVGNLLTKQTADDFDTIWSPPAGHVVQQLMANVTVPNDNGTPLPIVIQDTSVLVNPSDGSIRVVVLYISNVTAMPTNFGIGIYCYPVAIIDQTTVTVLPLGNAWSRYGEPAGTVVQALGNQVMITPIPPPTASAMTQSLGGQFTIPASPTATTSLPVTASYAFRPFAGNGICFCLRNATNPAIMAFFQVIGITSNTTITIRSFDGQSYGPAAPAGTLFPSGLIFPCVPPGAAVVDQPTTFTGNVAMPVTGDETAGTVIATLTIPPAALPQQPFIWAALGNGDGGAFLLIADGSVGPTSGTYSAQVSDDGGTTWTPFATWTINPVMFPGGPPILARGGAASPGANYAHAYDPAVNTQGIQLRCVVTTATNPFSGANFTFAFEGRIIVYP